MEGYLVGGILELATLIPRDEHELAATYLGATLVLMCSSAIRPTATCSLRAECPEPRLGCGGARAGVTPPGPLPVRSQSRHLCDARRPPRASPAFSRGTRRPAPPRRGVVIRDHSTLVDLGGFSPDRVPAWPVLLRPVRSSQTASTCQPVATPKNSTISHVSADWSRAAAVVSNGCGSPWPARSPYWRTSRRGSRCLAWRTSRRSTT